MQEPVNQSLDYNRWFREQVQIGLAQAEGGEFVTHEEVGKRIVQGDRGRRLLNLRL